jgi:hypothetical protein
MKQTPNYTKGVVLFLILVLPSLLYLYLTSGKHNFVYLPIIASQSQDYTPLLDENRQGIPEHHFISNFPLTDSLSFRDLDNKIKLVFFSNADDTLTNQLIGYMFQTEVWAHLGNYEDIYFLNFVVQDSTSTFEESIFEENTIPKAQWLNIAISQDSLMSILDHNIFVGELGAKVTPLGKVKVGETIICDREGRMRTGYNNSNKMMLSYNSLSKFEIKLLRDDLKVLLAEYQRELKR